MHNGIHYVIHAGDETVVRQRQQDRFLLLRDGLYYYWRRVPKSVEHLDDRAPFIRHSLKTDDLAEARAKRDLLEQADRAFWGRCSPTATTRRRSPPIRWRGPAPHTEQGAAFVVADEAPADLFRRHLHVAQLLGMR